MAANVAGTSCCWEEWATYCVHLVHFCSQLREDKRLCSLFGFFCPKKKKESGIVLPKTDCRLYTISLSCKCSIKRSSQLHYFAALFSITVPTSVIGLKKYKKRENLSPFNRLIMGTARPFFNMT